jgi:hypothetical protein
VCLSYGDKEYNKEFLAVASIIKVFSRHL